MISHRRPGYDFLRALGFRLVISHTRQVHDLLRALGSAFCDVAHETGEGLRFATDIRFCVL